MEFEDVRHQLRISEVPLLIDSVILRTHRQTHRLAARLADELYHRLRMPVRCYSSNHVFGTIPIFFGSTIGALVRI